MWRVRDGRGRTAVPRVDANANDTIDIADAITSLVALFTGGESLPAPYPDCGTARASLGGSRSSRYGTAGLHDTLTQFGDLQIEFRRRLSTVVVGELAMQLRLVEVRWLADH